MFFNFSMDGEDTAWLVVLEKKGLHQAAGILESYGIDSETDVSLLDQDDFSKLASNGLKPMEGKKLERWCNTVRAPAENMLTSSLNTPAGAALPSSETLNVLTLPARSKETYVRPTHPTLALLNVSLASSIRLTMTIRRGGTPTTFNCRCSRSLTNETCSSRVFR